jgi:hypothetical protein
MDRMTEIRKTIPLIVEGTLYESIDGLPRLPDAGTTPKAEWSCDFGIWRYSVTIDGVTIHTSKYK